MIKIGDRACETQGARPAASGNPTGLRRLNQQGSSRRVERGNSFKPLAVGVRVQGARLFSGVFSSRCGQTTRRRYTRGDLGSALARRRQGQVGGCDGWDFDRQVDAIEQRSRNPALIDLPASRRLAAGAAPQTAVPATA